ncbi:hypothetical protein CLIB1423_37S00584 [[Candida] railenensis]|uniref:HORMA domain-containing protein n=1 Tax=[Candida] railenensis TaxID=45579 RepID=A0A9P0QVR0_9ASCO|nr:hypothetical protein CLIB1423_37S00584 [[Candida] railenensis]
MLSSIQSLSVTKEFIFVTLSSILYTRSVFPEENFEGKEYQLETGGSRYIKVLSKGISTEGDNLLHLIQNSIFLSLSRASLSSVELTINDEKGKLLESYSLVITYPMYSCRRIDKKNLHGANTSTVNDCFFRTHSKLTTSTQAANLLPTKKSVAISLISNAKQMPHSVSACSELHPPAVHGHYSQSLITIGNLYSVYCDVKIKTSLLVHTPCTSTFLAPNLKHEITNEPGCECNTNISVLKEVYGRRIGPCRSCVKCSRKIHIWCYADNTKNNKTEIVCYSCLCNDSNLPSKVTMIMRVRFLWKLFHNYDLPESTDFFNILFSKTNVVELLNTMIKYNILEHSTNILHIASQPHVIKPKTKFIKIGLHGLHNGNGYNFEIGDEPYFIFAPTLSNQKALKLRYEKSTESEFFPSQKVCSQEELVKYVEKL